MGFEPPFTAIHVDGYHEHLDTIEELHPMRKRFGTKHRFMERRWDGTLMPRTVEWIVRDALGATVSPEDVPWPTPRRASWARRGELVRLAAERGLPIPGSGGRGSYRWHRRIAFHGDNRAASAIENDLAGELDMLESRHLGALRKARLVDGWDAGDRSCERSWKDHRATRWK